MTRTFIFSTLFSLLSLWANAENTNIRAYRENYATSKDSFFQNFPFDAYVKTMDMSTFSEFQEDIEALESAGLKSKIFILKVFRAYFTLHQGKKDAPYLLSLYQAGSKAAFLGSSDSTNQYFKGISQMIFGDLSQKIQEELDSGRIDPKAKPFNTIINDLEGHGYTFNIPISNLSKGWHHLTKGNWGYLWKKMSTTYLKELILGMFAIILMVITIYITFKKFRKSNVQN